MEATPPTPQPGSTPMEATPNTTTASTVKRKHRKQTKSVAGNGAFAGATEMNAIQSNAIMMVAPTLNTFSVGMTGPFPDMLPQHNQKKRKLSPLEIKNPYRDMQTSFDSHLQEILRLAKTGNHTWEMNMRKNEFFDEVIYGLSKHRQGNTDTAKTNVRFMDVGLQIARNIVCMGIQMTLCDKRDSRHVENVNMEQFASKMMAVCECFFRSTKTPSTMPKNNVNEAVKNTEKTTQTSSDDFKYVDKICLDDRYSFWGEAHELLSVKPGFYDSDSFNLSASEAIYLEIEKDKQYLLERNEDLKNKNQDLENEKQGLKLQQDSLEKQLQEAREIISKLETKSFQPDMSLEFISMSDAIRNRDCEQRNMLEWEVYDSSCDTNPFYELVLPD
tara:strand:+ start:8837 stop:9997 length:1161 start_codon:yes stop_codon:yes gene_type:complete